MGYDLDVPQSLVNTPPYKGNGIVAAQKTAGLIDLVQLKLDRNISAVYEKYYNCTARDLATSNDRFGVMLPSNERSGLTAHIDANPNKEREAIDEDMLQGFVVLNDSVDETQGFVIYPGHANNPGKWANRNCRGDFYLLSDEQKDQLGQGYIISPCAGSMVVWLSTAVHANNNGKGKKDEMGRMVAYVAKYPWSRISVSAADILENAIINKITLGHNTKRPSAQKTGNVRFGPDIDWQFGQAYLTNYNSREDIPELLRKPVN